jgi:DNA excision repair protein ERCC-4
VDDIANEILPDDDRLCIVIDTREKEKLGKHWKFDQRQVSVIWEKLHEGDYTVNGLQGRVVLERKTCGDWVNTVIHDWIRFRKELIRLSGYEAAAIVVEADLGQIYRGEYESNALPASVLSRGNAVFLDHGIPVFYWGSDRQQCADMAHRFLLLAWKKFHDR